METVKKKALIFGAAGRVGLDMVKALLHHPIDIAVADNVNPKRLKEKIFRAIVEARLFHDDLRSTVNIYGGLDVLDEAKVGELLVKEKPDIVVNYAIPFTWDATKRLPNYEKISRAGLGAFAAVQALAPKIVARAIAVSEVGATYIVGNLPDITIPILYGLKEKEGLALPVSGAGNVGLIEAALKHQIATERRINAWELTVLLVAHHVHWVAPREPGYRNDAPFLLKVLHQKNDITDSLGDLRALMNRAILNCYEPGAGFSSTTALLAAKLVLGLLHDQKQFHMQHVPAPNGLPGGYPVIVKNGEIRTNLPSEWRQADAEELMRQAHQRDGINKIAKDGSIHFHPRSIAILKKELGMELPAIVSPGELELVAKEQIRIAQHAVKSLS